MIIPSQCTKPGYCRQFLIHDFKNQVFHLLSIEIIDFILYDARYIKLLKENRQMVCRELNIELFHHLLHMQLGFFVQSDSHIEQRFNDLIDLLRQPG